MLKSDRLVEYDGEEQRIDAVHEQVELTDRELDGETYKIRTKKLPVSKLGEQNKLGEQKVVIAEKGNG